MDRQRDRDRGREGKLDFRLHGVQVEAELTRVSANKGDHFESVRWNLWPPPPPLLLSLPLQGARLPATKRTAINFNAFFPPLVHETDSNSKFRNFHSRSETRTWRKVFLTHACVACGTWTWRILSLEEEEEGEEKVQVMLADRWVKGGGRKGGGIAGRRMIYELLRGGGDRGSQVGRRSNLFFQSLSLSLSLFLPSSGVSMQCFQLAYLRDASKIWDNPDLLGEQRFGNRVF